MKAFTSLVTAAEAEYQDIERAIADYTHVQFISDQQRRYVRVSFAINFCKEEYAKIQQFNDFKSLFQRSAHYAYRQALHHRANVQFLTQAFNVGNLDRAIQQVGAAAHQGTAYIVLHAGSSVHWHQKVSFDRNLIALEATIEQD